MCVSTDVTPTRVKRELWAGTQVSRPVVQRYLPPKPTY